MTTVLEPTLIDDEPTLPVTRSRRLLPRIVVAFLLIGGAEAEIAVTQFDDRPRAGDGGADRRAHDGRLGDRRIDDAVAAELQLQALILAGDAALGAKVFATSRDEAAAFATAGADFVLVGDFIWADPRGAKAALTDAAQAIAQEYEAALGKARTSLTRPDTDNTGP